MNVPTIAQIKAIAKAKQFPIFESKGKFDFNLNIWGFRSPSKDYTKFNDLAIVFREDRQGHWFIDPFIITTDPSNLLLMNPVNIDGTAILCEGFHSKLWTYGHHKQRTDHRALVQHSPCKVYRDKDKDDVVDADLPIFEGMFGINMHRASAYGTTPNIGLYSAGCQVHADVDRYNHKFIPLIETSVSEGNNVFSYALCKEEWLKL